MSKIDFKLVDRYVRPRRAGGVDHGVVAEIIAMVPGERGARLLWSKGHNGWASTLDTKHYYASTLELDNSAGLPTTVSTGGRLSARRLTIHGDEIAAFFKIPAADRGEFDCALRRALIQKQTVEVVRIESGQCRVTLPRGGSCPYGDPCPVHASDSAT